MASGMTFCMASGMSVLLLLLLLLLLFCLLINTESDPVYPELPLASWTRVQSISSKLHKELLSQPVLGTSDFIFYLS